MRQAYKEGRLILVESTEPSSEEVSSDVWVDDLNTDTEVFEENTGGGWTFEPDAEKDDCTENYGEYIAVVEPELECCTQSPVELLIETFQNANTWEQIRVALLVHKDDKQEAWEVLTPIEKKRVRGLMPIEVKKLSKAKKAGLIVDFQELTRGCLPDTANGEYVGGSGEFVKVGCFFGSFAS